MEAHSKAMAQEQAKALEAQQKALAEEHAKLAESMHVTLKAVAGEKADVLEMQCKAAAGEYEKALETQRKTAAKEHANAMEAQRKAMAEEHAKVLKAQRKAAAYEYANPKETPTRVDMLEEQTKMIKLGWNKLSAECEARGLDKRGKVEVLAERLIAEGLDADSIREESEEEWERKLEALMEVEKHVAQNWTRQEAAKALTECKGNAAAAQRQLRGDQIDVGDYAEIAA